MNLELQHMNWLACLLLLLIPTSKSMFGQELPIVENHIPKANIIISSSSSDQIRNIATYLQSTLQKSTGAILPIIPFPKNTSIQIHIGYTDFIRRLKINIDSLDEDGFILKKIDQKNFVILGGSDWGTEFGVFSFLERFIGVQYLMPTDIGTEIPVLSSFYLPNANIVDNPIYISRQISPIYINQNNSLGKWGRFNRLRGRISFSHNLLNLYNPAEFSKTNPDFYSQPISSNEFRWQPNFSAKGIADTGAAKIIRFFKSNPTAHSYSLGINDGLHFDQSPASLARRKGTKNYLGMEDVSDDYFKWANDVVGKVAKIFPNKKFGLLAYNNIAEPPSPSIGVHPSIVPFITYERMRWADSLLEIKGHELNNAWAEEVKVLGWYDYTYGLYYFVPREWSHLMQQYLQWGAKNNVKYYYAELYPNWGEGPKPWVQAKLLWNPDYNVDSLLNVWYIGTAGKMAAPKLKEYYKIWETFWTKNILASKWNTREGQYLPFYNLSYLNDVPDSYLKRSNKLINEAYKLAKTPMQKERVSRLKEMWELYQLAVTIYKNNSIDQNLQHQNLITSPEFKAKLNILQKDPFHAQSVEWIKYYLKI